MNTAEYLIKKLEELGINDYFGLPGDYNFNILYAIEKNPNTHWYGCMNELNAGYAADGYARQRGYGAVVTTYGVGELSAMNAIAGSMAENVPVIHIVGAPATKCIEDKKRVHHNLADVKPYAFQDAFKPVVETTAFLNRDNAKIEIDRVLKIFVKEKKPVYIAIPLDIATLEISDRDVDYTWSSDSDVLEKLVTRIADKIRRAQKPVILGDALVKRFDSVIEYREFVEKSGIPVTNFVMGTNLIDADYEKYLGTYFSKYDNPEAQKWLEETDCLIAVGEMYGDLNSFGFNLPYKITSHIAIYGTYTYVEGERFDNVKMSDVLESLSKVVEKRDFVIEKGQIGYSEAPAPNGNLTSEYIYPRLQEYIKENDIFIAETGIIPQGVSKIKFSSNVDFNAQLLWGSIGWATPATFGACVASPNSRVILFTGDGSHQLTAMELGSMLRYGLKPVIIVLNNNGYTIERLLSDKPEDSFNEIATMNYSKFARVFEGDVWSTRVTTADDFDKALKVTQIMNKLCYIEVCTDKMDIPAITGEVVSDFKNPCVENKVQVKKTPECKISKDMDFGTTVHESFRGMED